MPGNPKQPGRPQHDASYKGLFASPRTVADTLRYALQELATRLDFSTLERLPASHLFPPAPEQLVGYVPRHRYLLIELQALDASVLPLENVLSMVARLEQARSGRQLKQLVVSLVNWLERAGEPNLLKTFLAWVQLVRAHRMGLAEGALELDFSREEHETMTTLLERVRKWGEEDMERGRLEGSRELVRRLVSRRYGPVTAERLAAVLDQLSDTEHIAAVADAVLECRTAEEFIARAREAAGTP